MKKLLSTALALLFLLALLPGNILAAEIVDSGACGNEGSGVTWSLDAAGKLTISGSGEMEDYANALVARNTETGETMIVGGAPWHRYYAAIRSIAVEAGVTGIGAKAFWNCINAADVSLPDTLTGIGNNAFSYTAITAAAIPGSVLRIGDSAFYRCEDLKDLTLAEGTESLGKWAFASCPALREIRIPGTVTEISDGAFQDCDGLSAVSVSAENPKYHSAGGCIIETAEKRLILGSADGVVPADGSVAVIGRWAYNGCDGLKTIRIPETVTEIGYAAFYNCANLTEAVIPDSVVLIDEWAFNYCTALTGITLPKGLKTVSGGMFDHCTALKTAAIPAGVTAIGTNAFNTCSALEAVAIPAGVTEIGQAAFAFCDALTEVSVPESVTTLGPAAFAMCRSLTGVEIMGKIGGLEKDLFNGCEKLRKLTITDGVGYIKEAALHGCTALSDLYYYGSKAAWKSTQVESAGNEGIGFTVHFVEVVTTTTVTHVPFTDIRTTDYYFDAVVWALQNNVTKGVSETAFGPMNTCTRGQVVTFLHRAMGEPAPAAEENPFADVAENAYYRNAVLWAVEQGITNGTGRDADTGKQLFSPDAPCSYAHILTFLWRCVTGKSASSYGQWHSEPLDWASEQGLPANTVPGNDPGRVMENCPRCDVVTYLWRALEKAE